MNLFILKLNRWKALIFLNAIYAIAGLAWIVLIPYNNAPDENTHFHYSVEFMIQNHRLPVWGVDDLERFQHALSSYNQMPALNYVLYAIGAAAGNKLFGLETYLGARLVSLLWGIIFLNFLFLAIKEACGNEKNALMITAAFTLIPQVLFSFCYVNADAHSLAIAAILGYALARFFRAQTMIGGRAIFLGASIGLLFSAKYNYYIYFPCIAVIILWAALRRMISWKTTGELIIVSGALSLLISGFWFIRNSMLYGNPLPILMSEDFFKAIAVAREVQPVNHGLTFASLAWLVKQGFISSTFDSFFAVFGYLNVGFHQWVYIILEFAVPALAAFFIIAVWLTRDRSARLALLALLIMIGLVMAMHVWACLTFDYQAQGRYNFTILLPIALFTGWIITRFVSLKKYAVILLVLTACLFIGANLLVVRTYGAPAQFSVSQMEKDGGKPSRFTARRTIKNYYATEKITIGNEPMARIKIGLSDKFLARYRDFKVELETNAGLTNNDWALNPPAGLINVAFNPSLTAFETRGHDACFILPLPAKTKSVRILFRLEHRRLYDLE